MQNIVVDMCEKFHNDRLRNDRALVLWISDNNRDVTLEITCLSDFRYLAPFRRYLRSKSEVVEKCPKFSMFWSPFFGGSAPRIFGLNLSNRTSFRSCGKASRRSVEGRRREPGERKKRKKHHEHFISPPVTTYGRPKKQSETETSARRTQRRPPAKVTWRHRARDHPIRHMPFLIGDPLWRSRLYLRPFSFSRFGLQCLRSAAGNSNIFTRMISYGWPLQRITAVKSSQT